MRAPHRCRSGHRTALALTIALTSCGTIGSPSTGDVDLPFNYLGTYQRLDTTQSPRGASILVAASAAATSADEPSVIHFGGHRVAYVTLIPARGPTSIGRASEHTESAPDTLSFDGARPVLSADQPWEGGAIASPSAVVTDTNEVVLAYAGQGGIGLAHSTDGVAFTKRAEPILLPLGSMDGGVESLQQPSLARSTDGQWYLAFTSGAQIFIAQAESVDGPWTRSPAPILSPTVADSADAGTAFESRAVSDPVLTILTTPTQRAIFTLFYTASGPTGPSVVGAAGSYDGFSYSRTGRAAFSDRTNSVRAGSLEIVDARTALLWVGTGSANNRGATAAIGPVTPRVPPLGR